MDYVASMFPTCHPWIFGQVFGLCDVVSLFACKILGGEWYKSKNCIHQHVACCSCLDWSFDFERFWYILMMVMMLMWSGWPSKLSPNCRVNNNKCPGPGGIQEQVRPNRTKWHQLSYLAISAWFTSPHPDQHWIWNRKAPLPHGTIHKKYCFLHSKPSERSLCTMYGVLAVTRRYKPTSQNQTQSRYLAFIIYTYIYIYLNMYIYIRIYTYIHIYLCVLYVYHSASEIRTIDISSQGIANSKSTVRSTLWDVPSIMATRHGKTRLVFDIIL